MSQELIKAGHEVVSENIVSKIQSVVSEFNISSEQLKQQADRAVVDSDESLAKAGDFVKIVRAQQKKAEDTRKKLITPVRGFLDTVNALFKTSWNNRECARHIIERKAGKYQKEREAAARAEAERLRKEAEERALRDAEAMQKAGDDGGANDVLDFGAKAAEKLERQAKPELVRGDYGSTVGSRREVSGSVTNPEAFLRAIADGKAGDWRDLVAFKQAGLNSLARKLIDDTNAPVVPGFQAKAESKVSFK